MRGVLLFFLGLLTCSALLPAFKPWYNYYNSTYGTKAISMGNAFTAVADDGTAAYWNPAGFSFFDEPKFYLSYRTDAQRMSELERHPTPEKMENYDFQFRSKLKQIDFFSIALPIHRKNWNWGGALSYYRYMPTGFKGYSESVYYVTVPWVLQKLHRLEFTGSEGIDVLALSASLSYRRLFSLGVTLQNFFNTANIEYRQITQGGSLSQSESKLMGGKNWIFGILFSPFRFLTVGASYQTSLQGSIRSTSQSLSSQPEGDENDPVVNELNVRLPSRIALGLKIEPFPFLLLAYDYSKIFWQKEMIQGFETFNRNIFFSRREGEDFKKQSPQNHRFGFQARWSWKKREIFLRGGGFIERELYSDISDTPVVVRGFSLGVGVRFSPDLSLEIAYQHPKAKWKESSFFFRDTSLNSYYSADIFCLSMVYHFKRLFQTH